MKTYTITVNGTAYDVTVEETAGGAAPAPAAKAAPGGSSSSSGTGTCSGKSSRRRSRICRDQCTDAG